MSKKINMCAVCNNTRDICSLFAVPKNEERAKKWIEAILPCLRSNQINPEKAFVCSAHFPVESFHCPIFKNRLLPNSFPTLSLNIQGYLENDMEMDVDIDKNIETENNKIPFSIQNCENTSENLESVQKEYRFSYECRPLRSNEELLSFYRLPILWTNLVEPIVPKCRSRFLGENYERLSYPSESEFIIESDRPEVLVCHDLAGNYREDRFINGSSKWDDYRFYHWAGIDYFCYFSHEYITIPTLPWINAAHRNGVKVLGTIIVELARGRLLLEQIISSEQYMKSVVDSLVMITKCCKFEGWLLNIECTLAKSKIPLLCNFLEHLTNRIHAEIPGGVVIWYDSIINTGALIWQNELNHKNKMFFDVCDGILINYTWTDKHLERTAQVIADDRQVISRMKNVFIGIDVFGRGQVAKFESHLTLAKIKKHKFSIGIFAPGWTFEGSNEFGINISSPLGNELCNSYFIERNDRFWSMLWKYLYTSGPTVLPFYTSFCLGSGKIRHQDGIEYVSRRNWFNLSNQTWQPSVPLAIAKRVFNDAFDGGSCLRISSFNITNRLFVTDFSCSKDIVLSYAFKRPDHLDYELDFILNILDVRSGLYCQIICSNNDVNRSTEIGKHYVQPLKEQNLQRVLIAISQRYEKRLPSAGPINGWEIRYFYLSFENTINARITDIGFKASCSGRDDQCESNNILLGALSIHEGMKYQRLEGINIINSGDFISSSNMA